MNLHPYLEITDQSDYENIIQRLKAKGVRITETRKAVIAYMIRTHEHPSAEKIYSDLLSNFPKMSLATVYNNLKVLVEEGFVEEIKISHDKTTYFDFMGHEHLNVVCEKCGRIADFEDVDIPDLKREAEEQTGYKITKTQVLMYGICPECSKMMVAETSLVKKNHQIPCIINQKIAQKLIEKASMTVIARQLAISTSTVIRKLNDFRFKHDFSRLPEIMSWDEYAFTKGKMSFIAQDFEKLNIITVLEGRTQAVIRDHFIRYDRAVRCQVKIITIDMFSPYYALAKQLFPCAKIVLDRFHIVQHLSRAMSRIRVQIMNQFERKSHEYKAIKRYWKLIQKDSRKLSDKRFYRPTFRMHLTNKEILDKLLSYSE
ncbi:ISL3 family transposase, partial [Streptococcus anginosus]|uniref:ISL3 family transposase n=2 Tax=Streptococcus anginosus TaxID=1328 RepID=UPI002FF39D0D